MINWKLPFIDLILKDCINFSHIDTFFILCQERLLCPYLLLLPRTTSLRVITSFDIGNGIDFQSTNNDWSVKERVTPSYFNISYLFTPSCLNGICTTLCKEYSYSCNFLILILFLEKRTFCTGCRRHSIITFPSIFCGRSWFKPKMVVSNILKLAYFHRRNPTLDQDFYVC